MIQAFHHRDFDLARLAPHARGQVSVCLPARNEAATIGAIVSALAPLREARVIGQVVVVDGSTDDTAEIAARLGAEVHHQADLSPELGPVQGKGDAMWRALPLLRGEIVCFLDADTREFGAHYVRGLVGPLLCDRRISLVKAFYRRPFRIGDTVVPDGGGRVTELTARPLLERFYPELATIRQPLAGELAARRTLLERLPFVTGYGVEIAMLIDAYERVGLAGLAQVDLEVRQNAHQPLRDLGPMAGAVLAAVTARLARDGRLLADATAPILERFPHAESSPPSGSGPAQSAPPNARSAMRLPTAAASK